MKSKSLKTLILAINNLKHKPFRTACLVAIVSILAFILFGGAILGSSLENGLLSLESRLGADIMVVPEGNESNMEGILIKAEASNFYFSKDIEHQISQIEGVSQTTTQFFITPLSLACCASVIPIIAFDPETDFVIQPWISKVYSNSIKEGEMIAGSNILSDSKSKLMFFGRKYPIIAHLEKTATGLDESVYVTKDTMKQMVEDAKKVGADINTDENVEDSASSVLIKTDPKYDPKQVARQIRDKIPGVDILVSQNIISNIGNSLETFVSYINVVTLIIWILGTIVLLIVFSVTLNERKKEFAVLRILGATRKKLVSIVLTESLLISISGAIIGVTASSLVVFPFSTMISTKLELPYLLPQITKILSILELSLALSILIGPLASIYGSMKISKAETYLTMREGE